MHPLSRSSTVKIETMNPLEELSDKQKIKSMILVYMKQFRPGDRLLTDNVIKHIKSYYKRGIKEATIDRYRRELREEGKINHEIHDKKKREIVIL